MYKGYLQKDADKEPTPFQRAAWDALSVVDHGQLTTYQNMAMAIGRGPRAAQAMHNAIKAGVRDYGQELPWHRVVRANGQMYLSGDHGVDAQRIQRLESEGVIISDKGQIQHIENYLYDYGQ